MSRAQQLITDNIATWTGAIQARSTAGRGSNGKYELYGIKKLRELILELAVRGKLVPQDSNDEPASILLERIAVEKAELVKAKKIKRPKALPPVSDEEKPFELPDGWEWARINEPFILENGDRSKNYPNKSALVSEGIPFVNAGQLTDGSVSKNDLSFITKERFDILSGGKFQDGDILFCLRGSLGKCALVNDFGIGAIASSLIILRPIISHLEHFMMLALRSPLTFKNITKYDNGTAQPNLSGADLAKFSIPIPPLAEQQRIVQKVDELMALCDQLEQQTESSIEAHGTLVNTLLSTLTNSADADELQQNWARIAGHFDTLFTTEQSIDALKQTILQLAVMGKLVRQNPNDEPASVLLERIAAEKGRLVKEKKIKKQKPLPPIAENEKPFELPEGWEWCRLRDLGITATGKTPSTAKPDFFNGDIPFIGPGQITADGKVLPAEKFLSEKGSKESTDALFGDILTVCIGGSIGKSAIAPHRLTFNQQINAIHPIITNNKFTFYSLVAQSFIDSILSSATGSATPIINRSKWENLPVSVPPLEEQHRIVAKVDELMTLCDQLKDKLRQSQQTQVHLTDAIVEQALA